MDGIGENDGRQKRRPRRSQTEILTLILNSATLEFQRTGYGGTTTAAIARTAGVTEAQLFRYFRSKADLFRGSVLEPLNTKFEQFNASRLPADVRAADWRAGARTYVLELMHFIEAHRDMFMSLIVAQRYTQASVDGVGAVDSLQAYFEISSRSMSANITGDDVTDPNMVVRVSFASVLATVLFRDWLFPREAGSTEAIKKALVDFVLDGISLHHDPAGESEGI